MAAGATAQVEPAMTLERAEQLASTSSRTLEPREALMIAERWPSPVFGPLPWSLLPTGVATSLHVKARYFDVVLSDMQTGALDEQIAIAYILSERTALDRKGAKSDALLVEVRYRDLVSQRDASRAWQRGARSMLALALGSPGSLHPEVEEAEVQLPVPETGSKPPEAGAGAERTQAWHLFDSRIDAARSDLQAARKRLQLAEVRQDELRADASSLAAVGALRLGEAMAAVAAALVEVRRAEYRLIVFHGMARALAMTPP